MHFYEWNIGDYAKKTQHLTNEEDLAYRRALDMYYDTEKPLDITNIPSLSRRLRVGIEALQNVIDEFFPGGKNKHAEEKIAAYYAFIDRQKANGKLGGRPKKTQAFPKPNPSQTQKNPVPSQPLTTNPLPTEPLTTEPEESTRAGSLCKRLRVIGIQAAPHQQQLLDILPRFTDEQIIAVAELAISKKPGERISVGYLVPMLEDKGKPTRSPKPDNFADKDYGKEITPL